MKVCQFIAPILFVFAAACQTCRLPRPTVASSAVPEIQVLRELTILAAGDILMHGAVKKSAEAAGRKAYGFQTLFADLQIDIKGADYAFANLETPVSTSQAQSPRSFVFNSPIHLVGALKEVGFDVVSVANNHMYDQEQAGLIETLRELDKAKLAYVGAGPTAENAMRPHIFEKNDIRIAFLGFTEFLNRNLNIEASSSPRVNVFDSAQAVIAIGKARETADFVVVSMHWGEEYESTPSARMRKTAGDLFEAGADVILGHHPHVLGPIEVYKTKDHRRCAVIYSMGNFISNQSRFYIENVSPERMGDTRDGTLFHFKVQRRDYGKGVVRNELADVFYIPAWTENNELDRGVGEAPRIRVVSIDKAIDRIKLKLEKLRAEEKEEFLELRRMHETLVKRRRRILDRLGDEYVR